MLQHHEASCNKIYIPPMPERSGLLLFVPVNPFAGLEIATYLLYILQRMRRSYYLLAEK